MSLLSAKDGPERLTVILVGQTAPPRNGMSSATEPLLAIEAVDLRFLDLGDSRLLLTSGRWSIGNVLDALGAFMKLLRLKPWTADLAHVPIAQNTPGLLRDALLMLVLRISRVPYLVHLHGGSFDQWYCGASPISRWIARETVGRARRGLVLSIELRRCLECILPTSRILVCENGIAPQRASSRREGVYRLTVLHIGSLQTGKGTLDLIQAVGSAEGVQLLLAGEPWPEIESAARRSRNVTFVGEVSGASKAALFGEADVVCLPSRMAEGQPIALLEAMSASLPVVTTEQPAIVDAVGSAGLYVKAGDVSALASALTTLRDDPVLRAALGACGRALYESRFTDDAYRTRIVAAWCDVARECGVIRN